MSNRPIFPTVKGNIQYKTCSRCQQTYTTEDFAPTNSFFYSDKKIPICNKCIKQILLDAELNWETVDKVCQYAGIPFIPVEWNKIQKINGSDSFPIYAKLFQDKEYQSLDWDQYFKAFKKLEEEEIICDEIPGLKEQHEKEMLEKWGPYSPEEYTYLENLLKGLMNTQNINGALQLDQALKICKISLELDNRIREGTEFDKLLASYDRLVKTAEFTPKNTKNMNDIDSIGELIKWLEKRDYKCKFFDNVSRDIVDETMKNIESYNQRLYTNENGIGEEITRRIEALKSAQEQEKYYDINDDSYDLENYENDGYNELMHEEFDPTGGDD